MPNITYWFVEVMSHRVCQCPDSVIQDQQVLVLKETEVHVHM